MLKATWTHLDIIDESTLYEMMEQFNKDNKDIIAAAFDTETTGLHHIYDKPFLFQFGWVTKQLQGYTYTVDLEVQEELARRTITMWNIMAARTPIYLGHNVKFDLNMLINIRIPYTVNNISDTMIYIRLAADAIPERKGGTPLGLKKFAKQFISPSAKDMDNKLQEERKEISTKLNKQLKQELHWTKKKIDEFFNDKMNTWQDLPEPQRSGYQRWHDNLPLYLQHITSACTSDDIPYHKLNRANVKYYGHYDIVWTLETWLLTAEVIHIRKNKEAKEIEDNNIYPLVRMERVGFKIDYPYLKAAKEKLHDYILIRRQDLERIAGEPLKCSQSKLILQLLQQRFGLTEVTTTNADELGKICSDLKHAGNNVDAVEFIETLQELRTLEKWYSTYIMRFLKNYKEEDGKLYTTINQVGTVSGRVTSDFQQFPKDGITTLDGEEIFQPRKMVLAKDKDFIGIVYLDYSQVELRLQAFYTILIGHPDTNLCRAYMPYKCHTKDISFDYTNHRHIEHAYDWEWFYDEEPEKQWTPLDVHGATTKEAFDITEEDPEYKHLRYVGKRVNFAKNYGAQYGKIKEMFPEYDDEQIKRIDEAYYKAFPGVKEYHNYCYTMANQQPYLSNMFGTRYYNASGHNLINMLVQGTGAYLLKTKIIKVDQYLKKHNCKSELMMQIHDEIQLKWHKSDSPDIFFDIKKIMEEWNDTYVPIVSDMEVTFTNWAEKQEVNNKEELYEIYTRHRPVRNI